MSRRWVPVAALIGLLFVINAVARLIVWRAHLVDEDQQTKIGLIAFIAIAVVFVVASAWWAIRYPPLRVAGDMLVAAVGGCLTSVLLGPFFGGSTPFAGSNGFILLQIIQYMLLAALGALLGALAVTAVGKDWKTRQWKRREVALKAKGDRSSR